MDELDEKINNFINVFEKNLQAIKSVNFNVSNNLFKKILCVSLIDALSKTVYPTEGNRKRFGLFIKEFCDWQYSEKVSLPHLIRLLKKVPNPEFSDLRKYASSSIESWKKSDDITLDRDLDIDDVKEKLPKGHDLAFKISIEGGSPKKIEIDYITHVNLLYRYRNKVIHETCRLSSGKIDEEDDKVPCYNIVSKYSVSKCKDEGEYWGLTYPLGFFYSLCENGLKNLKKYLHDNSLNPYDYFVFGDYWIDDLNR